MNNVIELEFPKTISTLAGNPYGKEVYEKQVKDKFRLDVVNIICFPNNIDDLATSFIQGFFAEIVKITGHDNFYSAVKIQSIHERIKRRIEENLF